MLRVESILKLRCGPVRQAPRSGIASALRDACGVLGVLLLALLCVYLMMLACADDVALLQNVTHPVVELIQE
ncbi:MAG: hypothetical protein K2R98_13250 [Gemmataceae bacterium]|nr:hypothetical protein [Gemmataceae bacterium]